MSNIGEKLIVFEEQTEETEDPVTGNGSGPHPEDIIEAQENGEDDTVWETFRS